jgi:prepilin-type N-terminal cleavage/methylation domain-containing protein
MHYSLGFCTCAVKHESRWKGRYVKKCGHKLTQGSQERGFSLIEMIVVIVIIGIILAMTLLELQPTVQQFRANAALDQVKGAMRQARELAISERRTIVVQFLNNNTVELWEINVGAGGVQTLAAAPFMTLPIESTVSFMTFPGEPDTPDAYGIPAVPSGVEFAGVVNGPPIGMEFQSDGTFTDANGNPINGTVFLGITNIPTTSRAVTILGGTGRVHAWKGSGLSWFQ